MKDELKKEQNTEINDVNISEEVMSGCDSLVFSYTPKTGFDENDTTILNPNGSFQFFNHKINFVVTNYSLENYFSLATLSINNSLSNYQKSIPETGFGIYGFNNIILKNVQSAFKIYAEDILLIDSELILISNNGFLPLANVTNVIKEMEDNYFRFSKRVYLPCKIDNKIKLREIKFEMVDHYDCKMNFFSGPLPPGLNIQDCYIIQDLKIKMTPQKEEIVSIKNNFYYWNGSEGKLVKSVEQKYD